MDNGYSWVILAGSIVNYLIAFGNMKAFGILYTELLATYGDDLDTTLIPIGSTQRCISFIIGPISGFMSLKFSFRRVTIIGSFVAALGLISSSFVTHPTILYFTYSTVIGFGFGLTISPSLSIVSYYFDKRRAAANGFMVSAGGLSTFVFPALYRFLFDTYGLHGGMLIIGGITLNMIVSSALFRQPRSLLKNHESKHIMEENESIFNVLLNHLKTLFYTFKSVLGNRPYVFFAMAISCALIGFAINFVIIPPHLQSRGITKAEIARMFMTMGAVEIFARLLNGILSGKKFMVPEIMFMVNIGMSGVFCLLFPFLNYIALYYVYCVTVGLFTSQFITFVPTLMISVCGLDLLPPALALVLALGETCCTIITPITAWLENITGSWNAAFYFIGAIQMMSPILTFIGYRQVRMSQKGTIPKDIKEKAENIPMLEECNVKS